MTSIDRLLDLFVSLDPRQRNFSCLFLYDSAFDGFLCLFPVDLSSESEPHAVADALKTYISMCGGLFPPIYYRTLSLQLWLSTAVAAPADLVLLLRVTQLNRCGIRFPAVRGGPSSSLVGSINRFPAHCERKELPAFVQDALFHCLEEVRALVASSRLVCLGFLILLLHSAPSIL